MKPGRAVVAAAIVAGIAGLGTAARAQAPAINEGRILFEESCASCHGLDGAGTEFGPSLRNAGAASADFYLRTGRMPLADPTAQAMRKTPAFEDDEIAALVAYVASLGDGPPIPEIHPDGGELPLGQELFANNCAPCHGATGNGGAAGPNALAPSLLASEPLDVAEAVVIGPGEMPVFNFDQEHLDSIVAYVAYLRDASDPGGGDLGQIGPVPEGYIALVVGTAIIVAITMFVGGRVGAGRKRDEDAPS